MFSSPFSYTIYFRLVCIYISRSYNHIPNSWMTVLLISLLVLTFHVNKHLSLLFLDTVHNMEFFLNNCGIPTYLIYK